MNVRVWTSRYLRDLNRLHLAQRMIALGARTQIVVLWTGLSTVQVRSLCHEVSADAEEPIARRQRGPGPRNVHLLLKSERWRNEAAGFIGLCYVLEAMPSSLVKNAQRELPNLIRGERLCRAYEMYRSCAPGQSLDFDRALLLFTAVAQGTEIKAVGCAGCGAVILQDARGIGRWHCAHCSEGSDLRIEPGANSGWYKHSSRQGPAGSP
ncbi:MAG: hypothetical protein IT480_18905 [Gammaproteobacteria bacterium]|nr:hypothetical protein [Gammaproteobacteria bacterium]